MKRIAPLSVVGCLGLLFAASTCFATQVTINSASIDYSTNQITVTGAGFCFNGVLPTVAFGTTQLTVTSACSNTTITAALPVFSPGSYPLTVSVGPGAAHSTNLAMTYGADVRAKSQHHVCTWDKYRFH